ncbi:acyl-CoA dehydrogenase, partial [bacterium]|nr:acyl-CoA dehydrogenase [bacterium]
RFGNEDLKEKFLPQVAEGEILSSGAFSETQRGGDYGDVKTTAVRQGEKWVITGTKTNVINGGKAGFYIVLCQTNSAAASAEQGKSMILVEANSTGLSFQNSGKKLGGNMTATATLSLDGVRVPAGNLVGKEGEGFSQLMMFLNESRVIAAAQALGTAMGSFDRALDYAKEREQFNKKLAQFQISQHKIADMATKIELAKLVTYKAAWSLDKGQADAKLSSMAKITACRTAMEVGAQTIQLFGGYGYMTEYEVERYYRDAKVIELLAGTRDVQKDIIAQSIIGKIK